MKTLAKWTTEGYHRMIKAGILQGRPVELLGGEIVEITPDEGPSHRYYSETLADYLRLELTGKALVREGRPITLSDSEPEPDISVVKLPRDRYRDCHPSAEDIFWVIEVSYSSLPKDLDLKVQIYAQSEIKEYWILNLKAQQLPMFRAPQGDRYLSKQEVQQG